jgi:hypothetical protein
MVCPCQWTAARGAGRRVGGVGGAGSNGARLRKKVNKVVQKKWWNILKGAFLLSTFRVSRLRECFLARKSCFFSVMHPRIYSLQFEGSTELLLFSLVSDAITTRGRTCK